MTHAAGERCGWCGTDPLYVAYHDEEWGVPLRADRDLFEFLILEGMQAGLSWLTVLRKRENFRVALAGFDPEVIARFGDHDRQRLLADAGIIRNRQKVEAVIGNARAVLELRDRGIALCDRLWDCVDGTPRQNEWSTLGAVPAATAESTALSRRLRADGFRFVGPTICYALMQATGMVNDHLVTCPRHRACRALSAR